jgi:hypothetical protein
VFESILVFVPPNNATTARTLEFSSYNSISNASVNPLNANFEEQ